MSHAHKALVLGILGGQQTLASYLAGLGMDLAYPLLEASGSTTILNAGSAGADGNATLLNAPARVTSGPFGGGYDFTAINHAIRLSDGTLKDAIEEAPAQTFSILWRPDAGGSRHILSYANTDRRLFFNASLAPRARYARGTTTADSTASTTLSTGVVQWLHMVMASNTIRLLRDAGTLAELAYTSQTAGAGTQVSSATDLYFGNRLALDLAVDGHIYYLAYGRVALSDAQLNVLGRMTPGLG